MHFIRTDYLKAQLKHEDKWNEIFISSVYVALIFDNDGNPNTVGMALK